MRQSLMCAAVLLSSLCAKSVLADNSNKVISSGFCQDFTSTQIPVGDFHPPSRLPLSVFRKTQAYDTQYEEGYCLVGKTQPSVDDSACVGHTIYYGHDGLDMHPAGSSDPGINDVTSVQKGLVMASHASGSFKGWGDSVIIATRPNKYSDEILTFHYHHLHSFKIDQVYKTTRRFNACDSVQAGEVIAKEGGTPNWPTHLHLSIKHWRNISELKDKITSNPRGFYGSGYSFGDDAKIANYCDPEGLLLNYFKEFNQLQSDYSDWQWSQPDALFMREKGWEFGLFDGRFGVDQPVENRTAARWLKLALELDTNLFPLLDSQGQILFADLNSKDPDYPYISTLTQKEQPIRIINPNNSCSTFAHNYCPDKHITRAAALKMVISGFYLNDFISTYDNWVWKTAAPLAQSLLSNFNDVSPLEWYAPYIYFAWQNQLISGSSDFHPDQEVNRSELAKWLVEAYQYKHGVMGALCDNIYCPENQYCQNSTGTCLDIPGCLPTDDYPCPLGGGYQYPNNTGGSSGTAGVAGSDNGAAGDTSTAGSTGGSNGTGGNSSTGGAGGTSAGQSGSSSGSAGFGGQPVCNCSSGACCDGCNYLPASQICDTPVEYNCSGTSPGSDVQYRQDTRYCTGFSNECIGQLTLGSWQISQNCSSTQNCIWNGSSSYCEDIAPSCQTTYLSSSSSACYSNSSASGSPTICLEVQQNSGSSWNWRVCKQGGTFSNAFSYQLLDYNHLSHGFGGTFTGSANSSCSNWRSADFSYLNADGPVNGAGLKVEVLSPSSCTTQACTYYSGYVTLYRDCL